MITIPKIGEHVIISAGYSDIEGEVLEITYKEVPVSQIKVFADIDKQASFPNTIKLKKDKKGKEIVEIDVDKIYAITHISK